MNTIICMQSALIPVIVKKLEEELSSADCIVDNELVIDHLTTMLRRDFTTLEPLSAILINDRQFTRRWIEFTDNILETFKRDISVKSIQVVNLNGPNLSVSVETY